MRATRISIHNFRSFADTELALKPFTLLVGANNSGKSNIIDAIRVFYEKDIKYEYERDFPKFATADKEAWIDIEFQPSEEEVKSLKQEYRQADGTFKVRRYLQSSEKDEDGKPKKDIYAYVKGTVSSSRFYGVKNVQKGKFGDIIYVPAVSKLDEHTKLTGPSALRDLINIVMKKLVDTSHSYKKLKAAFDEFGGTVKEEQTAEGFSLSGLESEISKEITEWGASFALRINPVTAEDIVKSLIEHEVYDQALNKPLDSKSYGQGFQRHLIFTLIRLAARYNAQPVVSTQKEFSPSLTWILFEEPEAFLHPSQIDGLDASLRNLASMDDGQVLITTHNPQFVSRSINDLPALGRLRKDDTQSKIWQVNTERLNKILEINQKDIETWRESGLPTEAEDMQLEMESIKYALWLNPLRCSAFFANTVLIVEGPTEAALINYLIRAGGIANPKGGLFVFDALGKYNIHRFMNLFGLLGITHAVLHDNDNTNKSHAAIYATISASKNECTIGVDVFEQDLETFLEIPKPKKQHSKPQHVMWYLHQGKIDKTKLDALATKVNKLVSIQPS